jgi:hypothetical protein
MLFIDNTFILCEKYFSRTPKNLNLTNDLTTYIQNMNMTTRVIKIKTNQPFVATKEPQTVSNATPKRVLINLQSKTTPVENQRRVRINLVSNTTAPEKKNEQKIKFHITKKIINDSYEVAIAEQKPKFVAHESITLPPQLQLKPFFYQNYCYLIDQTTKYIFLPDDIHEHNVNAIGKLIEQPIDVKKITKTSYPLANRSVEWYMRFELDTPAS